MERTKSPWQRRASEAGLDQRTLVILTGHDKTTISRQLRGYWQSGVPKHIRSIIIAWEVMNADQRQEWVSRVETQLADEAESPPTDTSLPQIS